MSATEFRELLPCPFCGKAAEVTDFGADEIGDWWLAGCSDCGIWLPAGGESPTREQAIEAWNTRAK